MQIEDVRRVLLIGSGTMGLQIGLQAATHGLEVTLYETDPAARETAPGRLRGYGEQQRAGGLLDTDALERSLARVTVSADPAAAGDGADLLIECVPEDPELKGRVLAQFNLLCPPRTVFATNTSTLLPSQFAGATGRPDHVIAMHFHLPVWINNLADVMPHEGTATQVTERVVQFVRDIGQVAIELRKEHNGYVFNAMYSAANREAIAMAEQGVASIQDIDRAWMHVTKSRQGPFGALDAVGIDTAWQIADYWARQPSSDPQVARNAAFLKAYVDRGELGMKAGRGFYSYPDPEFARPGFTEGA